MSTDTQPLSRTERAQLSVTLIEVGPDAPTLCEGWAARDLAVHLVMREARPDTVPGMLLPRVAALARHRRSVQEGLEARPWAELVELVRGGPPAWSPLRVPALDRVASSSEFFIHHEDVRRARLGWAPRELPEAAAETLWGVLRTQGRLFYRKAPVGVLLRRPDGVGLRARRGARSVTLTGEAQELLLHAMGRTTVARVHITGDAADVAEFSRTPLGI